MISGQNRVPASWWFMVAMIVLLFALNLLTNYKLDRLAQTLAIPVPTVYTVPREWNI